ncbi:Hypothetical predicted protein, partial [Olea europaea subsp. europaea]
VSRQFALVAEGPVVSPEDRAHGGEVGGAELGAGTVLGVGGRCTTTPVGGGKWCPSFWVVRTRSGAKRCEAARSETAECSPVRVLYTLEGADSTVCSYSILLVPSPFDATCSGELSSGGLYGAVRESRRAVIEAKARKGPPSRQARATRTRHGQGGLCHRS